MYGCGDMEWEGLYLGVYQEWMCIWYHCGMRDVFLVICIRDRSYRIVCGFVFGVIELELGCIELWRM